MIAGRKMSSWSENQSDSHAGSKANQRGKIKGGCFSLPSRHPCLPSAHAPTRRAAGSSLPDAWQAGWCSWRDHYTHLGPHCSGQKADQRSLFASKKPISKQQWVLESLWPEGLCFLPAILSKAWPLFANVHFLECSVLKKCDPTLSITKPARETTIFAAEKWNEDPWYSQQQQQQQNHHVSVLCEIRYRLTQGSYATRFKK